MQTTGTILLRVKLSSSVRMWMRVRDGRDVPGLLTYLLHGTTRVSKERCQAGLDTGLTVRSPGTGSSCPLTGTTQASRCDRISANSCHAPSLTSSSGHAMGTSALFLSSRCEQATLGLYPARVA
jgi:hypothetical protein